MIIPPTVTGVSQLNQTRISGLERNVRTTSQKDAFLLVTASGVAGTGLTREMSSSPYRPFYPCAVYAATVQLGSPCDTRFTVEIYLDGSPIVNLSVPPNAQFVRFDFPSGFLVRPDQTLRFASNDIDEVQAGSITVNLLGEAQHELTQSVVLGFPEQAVLPVPEGRIGPVWDIVIQPDGKILICGDFSFAGGQPRGRVARLNANGTIDTTFNPGIGANARVSKIQLMPSGKIYIGGDFTSFNGHARDRLALLNANGSLDLSFVPTDVPGGVSDFYAFENGRVLIMSRSISLSDLYYGRRFFYLNPDGTIDSTNLPPAPRVPFLYAGTMYRMPSNRFVFIRQADGAWISKPLWPTDTSLAAFKSFASSYGRASETSSGAILLPQKGIYGYQPGLEVVNSALTSSQYYYVGSDLKDARQTPDGKVLIAGSRVLNGATDMGSLVRLNSDYTIDESFNSENTINKSGSLLFQVTGRWVIRAVPLSSGKTIIGGKFTITDPADVFDRINLVRLNADGTLDTTFAVV